MYAVLVAVLIAAGAGAVTIAIIAAGLFAVQLFTSDKIALASMGAREVTPQQAPQLHAIIDRLCVQANIPKPRVAIAQTPMPNAFAVGRSPKSATVCATTGILQLLEPAELEAVLGHELTHVHQPRRRGDDDRELLRVDRGVHHPVRVLVRRRLRRRQPQQQQNNNGFFIVILVSAAVYVVSFLLLQALSRYREFAADRGSAILTGRPSALISALMKISGTMQRIPQRDLRAASSGARGVLHLPAQGQASRSRTCSRPIRRSRRGSSAFSGSRPSSRAPPDARVGFLDVLTGRRKLAQPAPDRLFAI